MEDWLKKISEFEGGIENFTQGYKYYGMHVEPDNSVVCREWAPGALALYLTGDFSEYFNSSYGG
jgi:1,4-alpha-glucan branching enzyme